MLFYLKKILILIYKIMLLTSIKFSNVLNIELWFINNNFYYLNWDIISYNKIYLLFFFIILFASIGVILSKNPVHSIFFLILVFLHVGFFLLLLNVEFLAFLLFIVYLGAIAVLFLFVIMMFNIHILESRDNIIRYLPLIILIFLVILEMNFINILEIIKWNINKYSFMELNYVYRNWYELLFTQDNIFLFSIIYNYYLYQFILASLILLIAMIGAIILTLNQNSVLKKQVYYKQNYKTAYNSLALMSPISHQFEIWELFYVTRKWKTDRVYPLIGKKRKMYVW